MENCKFQCKWQKGNPWLEAVKTTGKNTVDSMVRKAAECLSPIRDEGNNATNSHAMQKAGVKIL